MVIVYKKEELEKIINESGTLREVLSKFKRNDSSTNYRILHKHIELYSIDITHFLNHKERMTLFYEEGKMCKKDDKVLFCENSNVSRGIVKKRIINNNLIPYICIKCGQNEIWNNEKITLIMDHINGINNDNRLENLRFLCPNCNATLLTHCKGAKGLLPKEKKIDGRSLNKIRKRKVERPSIEVLQEEVKELGYTGVGRKYGVSDQAIRKWMTVILDNQPKKFRNIGKPKCLDCGIEINYSSKRCKKCSNLNRNSKLKPLIHILKKEVEINNIQVVC